ncbi:hypothetical protein [Amycolatopsis sp. NPDC049159]|uniref:hypothetical protein n=1 Tax=Amycolatopsis sp. NPDC049159 TaxID=3157210 RepID=UPI0033EE5E10
MLLAADAASAAGPPWLAIVVAALASIGVIATAFGPAIAEKVKRGKPKDEAKAAASTEPAALPTPTVVQRTDQALDLVGAAMTDAHRERDEAQARAERLSKANTKLERENAALRTLIYRLDPTWNGDSSGRSAG